MTTKKSNVYLASKSTLEFEKKILGKPLTFGGAVCALRERNEWSQTILALKIGVSRQYICDVEKGRRSVSLGQAARFAKALGQPPEILMQLALQDQMTEAGLKLKVTITA